LKVPMEGTAKRPVDFYGRGYLPGLSSLSLREGGARGAALEKRSAGGQTPVVGPKLFQAALDGPKP
jgi:hypothetical protein